MHTLAANQTLPFSEVSSAGIDLAAKQPKKCVNLGRCEEFELDLLSEFGMLTLKLISAGSQYAQGGVKLEILRAKPTQTDIFLFRGVALWCWNKLPCASPQLRNIPAFGACADVVVGAILQLVVAAALLRSA